MTRIIAGFAGSLRIAVPGRGTRPTSDRVREAIFSGLDARDAIDGARVLDLFAGSGALGLEAASRGATHLTLVDRVASTAALCRKNAALVLARAPKNATPTVEVSSQSVQAFLSSSTSVWDLVFLDPPYDLDAAELGRALESVATRLQPGATVILERSSRSPAPEWPTGLHLDRRKDYGDTALYWLHPA